MEDEQGAPDLVVPPASWPATSPSSARTAISWLRDLSVSVVIAIIVTLPLNLVSTGTFVFDTFSEIAFNFRVTPLLMLIALIFGVLIGFLGSLLPAIRATRFKIVDALRA